ncbi:MAG: aminotransferase class I/II-fold pyridoxal phosphate-dependent enzyme [Acidobacteriaceae bacterium]|nr:aminotransferase class I/II-fold pyridoxal phosphate-dependent enzyme [Acidobacteriaceae bacterium]
MAFVVEFSKCVEELGALQAVLPNDDVVANQWKIMAQAASEALSRGETHYTDRPGILPLRQKVSALLQKRFSLTVDAKASVVVTCGAVEARFVALQQLLEAGAGVWASESLQELIAGAACMRRATLTSSPEEAKLVYLASSLKENVLRATLAKVAPDAIVLFEVDEEGASFHPSQVGGFSERTITIGQLGDPAWQMGYLVAAGGFSAGLRDFKQALTICSTNLSQWAMLAAMEAQ